MSVEFTGTNPALPLALIWAAAISHNAFAWSSRPDTTKSSTHYQIGALSLSDRPGTSVKRGEVSEGPECSPYKPLMRRGTEPPRYSTVVATTVPGTLTQNTPGLGSNGEGRRKRDGLYPERLTVHAGCDGEPQRLPVSRNGSSVPRGVTNPCKEGLQPEGLLSAKTGYESGEDSRQVPSPTRFCERQLKTTFANSGPSLALELTGAHNSLSRNLINPQTASLGADVAVLPLGLLISINRSVKRV